MYEIVYRHFHHSRIAEGASQAERKTNLQGREPRDVVTKRRIRKHSRQRTLFLHTRGFSIIPCVRAAAGYERQRQTSEHRVGPRDTANIRGYHVTVLTPAAPLNPLGR
ncbi:hypothetical protein GWI33_007977 [Rhynchophorus ferrugineus]|uniref:Uncharacterized protein n=1 Tax=Rhynchophorus ferrugineus TaxID=354439 RepID=A0A834IGT4_RHYFE|nr:hypothetical protein GWI33_007977 [Rhynchophorus ferrugineus]